MNATLPLFPECPTRCGNVVVDPRWPCDECEAALAGYIRPADREVTPEEAVAELAERDRGVAAVYAARLIMTPLPEPVPAPVPASEPDVEWRDRPARSDVPRVELANGEKGSYRRFLSRTGKAPRTRPVSVFSLWASPA
jgi:hypothetical protein